MKSFMLNGTTATLVTCTKRAADSRTMDVGDRERTLRVRSALQACGVYEPQPAFPLFDFSPTAKGGALDLCAAIEFLQIRFDREKTDKFAFVGELSLDGTFRSTVRGVVSMVRAAKAAGLIIVIPAANEAEAACVHGAHVLVAETLREVIDHLEGRERGISRRAARGTPRRREDHDRQARSVALPRHDSGRGA
jgi:predicted ATPase with chaperone activity